MADEQTNFIPIGGRDAYATIRGYLYQIDVTISRWLPLERTTTEEQKEILRYAERTFKDDRIPLVGT